MTLSVGHDSRRREPTPGPAWYEMPGLYRRIRRDPTGELTALWKQYGDIFRIPVGPVPLYFIAHPEAIRQILLEGPEGYSKRTKDYEAMKPVLGEGLLTSEGPRWQRQRRAIQPSFRHSELIPLVETVARSTEETLRSWSAAFSGQEGFDVARELAGLTLTIVGRAILGVDLAPAAERIGPAVTLLNQHMAEDAAVVFEFPHWVPTPRNRRFRKAKRIVDREVFERAWDMASSEEGLGLAAMLKEARDAETGERMTETQIRDEIVTMMAAGHETTANALAWTLFCIAERPDVTDALGAELDSVLDGRAPTFEDLPKLSFTKMVLQESMRLYPPAWGVSRRAERDDVVLGHAIARGSSMQMIVYLLHRHPEFWADPERFDPLRFLPERSHDRHRFAYLPFGAGPRICIGRDFAMLESQVILAMLLQRFRFRLAPGHPVALEPVITLRPRYGMWMRIEERLDAPPIVAGSAHPPAPASV